MITISCPSSEIQEEEEEEDDDDETNNNKTCWSLIIVFLIRLSLLICVCFELTRIRTRVQSRQLINFPNFVESLPILECKTHVVTGTCRCSSQFTADNTYILQISADGWR